MARRSAWDRFWSRVAITPSCWLWLGKLDRDGYGHFGPTHNDIWIVHRWAYTMLVGPIPPGVDVHHTCETTNCVNPAHLQPTPKPDHGRLSPLARIRAAQTHCIHGHEFTTKNTHVARNGTRHCRECGRLFAQRKRREVRDAK